jgi:DNA-binding beta-propeller fold protein YncE
VAAAGGVALLAVALMAAVVCVSLARADPCSGSSPLEATSLVGRVAPAGRPTTTPVTGHPDAVAVTRDGQTAFVALAAWWPGDPNGIQVFHRGADGLRPVAIIPLPWAGGGLAFSPDGRLLLAALDDRLAVLDSARAATGDPVALQGTISTGPGSHTTDLAVAGDRYVVASDRAAGRVTVLDLRRVESGDFGPSVQVGAVAVDLAPDGLAFSPDGRYLYVVSQVQRPSLSLGPTDWAYGLLTGIGMPRRAGTLSVVDLKRVELDPSGAVERRVTAGCAPSQVAVSPDGGTVWVTASQSNEVLAYRSAHLLDGGPRAGPVARVRVPAGPAGIQLVRDGRYALVTSAGHPNGVSVLDTAAAMAGRPALRTVIPAGDPPARIGVTADQGTAYVTNGGSSSLTAIDLSTLR